MLRAEEAQRLAPATQAAYGVAEASFDSDWLKVTEELQKRVLRQHGVPPARLAAALYLLRTATQLFPHDDELQRIPLYVRHNRAEQGDLQPGDPLPSVTLHSLQSGAPTTLACACDGPQPTLLVAGSFT